MDPDGKRVQFGYVGADPRVVSRTDRRNFTTSFAYGPGGRLSQSSLPVPEAGHTITNGFTPGETRGRVVPVRAAAATTVYNGPRTDVPDTVAIWQNRWGAPTRVQDALGNVTVDIRGDPRFPALVTEQVAPNGLTSRVHYDLMARPDSMLVLNPLGDGRHALTTYEYDNKWHLPTRITAFGISGGVATQLVGSTRMGYDPATGNRLWQQQGEDDSRRVNFSYYPAGHPHAGQVSRVRGPSDVLHNVPGDSVAYDAWGNLQATVSTTGIVTSQVINDALGRPWVTVTPVNPALGLFRRDSVVYDAAGRVEKTISTGPAINQAPPTLISASGPGTTPAEQLWVTQQYDDEGNVLAVER
ncbi:MAG TPA: hypothetical protein VK358_03510, partial [Longimicrobium sp.]|nr:hypothetical protein [Longimicrobium sp.]